jgi:HSP20 family protein
MMWRDMEDMQAEAENMFQAVASGTRVLADEGTGDRMLPAIRGEFRGNVREHGDDVIVVADLPGVEKESVTLQLTNPRHLEIACTCERDAGKRRERQYPRTPFRFHEPDGYPDG